MSLSVRRNHPFTISVKHNRVFQDRATASTVLTESLSKKSHKSARRWWYTNLSSNGSCWKVPFFVCIFSPRDSPIIEALPFSFPSTSSSSLFCTPLYTKLTTTYLTSWFSPLLPSIFIYLPLFFFSNVSPCVGVTCVWTVFSLAYRLTFTVLQR